MIATFKSAPRIARYTWFRQLPAEALLGLTVGVTELAGFISQRSLGAPPWVVPLLVVAAQVPWMLAPAWEVLFSRTPPRRVFLWIGALQFLPLLAVVLVRPAPAGGFPGIPGDLVLFLVAVGMFHLMHGAFLPHRGALLRANYPEHVRGRIFASLAIVQMLAMLLASKSWGWLLDRDADWVRVAFPLAAGTGLAGCVMLWRIRWRRDGRPTPARDPGPRAALRAIGRAWRDTARILRGDKPFRTYELGFMLYGLGLLSSAPLVVLFGEGDLGLTYSQWANAQGVAGPIGFVSGMVLFGRLTDRLGPVRISCLAFVVLALFFAAVPLAAGPWQFAALFLLYGFAMSGVHTGWALGPLHFAPPGEARTYASAHVFLVGARSGVGPVLGYVLARTISIQFAFTVSAALVTAGALTLVHLRSATSRSRGAGPLS